MKALGPASAARLGQASDRLLPAIGRIHHVRVTLPVHHLQAASQLHHAGRQRHGAIQVSACKRSPVLCAAAGGSASYAGGAGQSAAQPLDRQPDSGSAGSSRTKLIVYVLFWYGSNIAFNIINKQTLNAFPMPYAIATWQLAASVLCGMVLWITNTIPRPRITGDFAKALLPVALFHTIGHVSACVSFSLMAVSFSHIVKSAEPVFSVLLSWPLLGKTYPWYVWLSLVPIVAGCSLSAAKEVTFAWPGFNNAMASNVGMVVRNILSKKLMGGYKDIGGINLFVLISLFSLIFCVPLALVMESHLWPAAVESAKASVGGAGLARMLVVGGLLYHLYNQASYMVLDLPGTSPVTLSVGNTMKRVAVVGSSVLFFRNPVGLLNWIGSFVAILGTGLYGVASDKASQKAKAA